MADNRNAGIQKFCLDFAETGTCRTLQCTRWHKHKRHFEIIEVKPDQHYILGRLNVVPLCRYYQTTRSCPHGVNCRYLHPLNLGLNNTITSSTSTPSTSANAVHVQNTNSDVVDRESLNETENACALSLIQQAQINCGKEDKNNTLRVNAPEFVPISPPRPSSSGNGRNEHNMNNNNHHNRPEKKKCGICFEAVLDKIDGEPKFGILPNCNHCYCLTCIRKWRQSRQFENQRSCPECRVKSDFVCPSDFWVETEEAKQKLIDNYKTVLSAKDCKYFSRGLGRCPFGNKCFYRHAFPDGSPCDVGPPRRNRRRVRGERLNTSATDVLQTVILWDFEDDAEEELHLRWQGFSDDFNHLVDFFSDSDSSWSGYEIFFD